MSYGPRFEIPHQIDNKPVTVVMRHAKDGDGAQLAGLLQDFTVQQFVSLQGGPSPKDEDEFLERIRIDKSGVLWIVAVRYEDGQEELVGTSGLHQEPGSRYESGILLCNQKLWRKGIAALTHEVRTWYAFCELGAYAIDSRYIEENVGSGAALRKVGYVDCGRRLRSHLTAGRWRDEVLLTAYNPLTVSVLWPDNDIPDDVRTGLKLTQAALDRAAELIQPR